MATPIPPPPPLPTSSQRGGRGSRDSIPPPPPPGRESDDEPEKPTRPRPTNADLADTHPTKIWKERGKTFGAAITFLAACFAIGKPQDETKTKAVYETMKPAIEITSDRVSALEGRIAVLEYRLREQASATPMPTSFEKEHPAPPSLPEVVVKAPAGSPAPAPAPIMSGKAPKALPAFEKLLARA